MFWLYSTVGAYTENLKNENINDKRNVGKGNEYNIGTVGNMTI